MKAASLARLSPRRAYAMQSKTAKAKAVYQGFFTLSKDADPDIPVLTRAKPEYATLHWFRGSLEERAWGAPRAVSG